MNWKTLVEKKNAKTFVLPSGWDSREEVARQLECSPDRVDDHLRPALTAGDVVKKQFKVWHVEQKRLVFVQAYQETPRDKKPAAAVSEFDAVRASELKKAGKSYREIGQALGGISGEAVRSKLRRVG
jgi:DNA-binding CsgD family transcriptional regulator